MHTSPNIIDVSDLKAGEHLTCIFKTDEEHHDLLSPFLANGLLNGEKVFYIMDDNHAHKIIEYISDAGLDVDSYIASGQFAIQTKDDSYLKNGVFDPDKMIDLLKKETQRALDEGYSALRVTGEMSWALKSLPGSERLIEYENKLNIFIPENKCLALCQYDKRRFRPEFLINVIRTHPIVVIGTKIYKNLFYLPPVNFTLAEQTQAPSNFYLDEIIKT